MVINKRNREKLFGRRKKFKVKSFFCVKLKAKQKPWEMRVYSHCGREALKLF
jgi:hypothetical protein